MFRNDFLSFPSLVAYACFLRKFDLKDGTMCAKGVFEYR